MWNQVSYGQCSCDCRLLYTTALIAITTVQIIAYLISHPQFYKLEIVITRAAPAFHKMFMVMGCVFDINTVHNTVEKLTAAIHSCERLSISVA